MTTMLQQKSDIVNQLREEILLPSQIYSAINGKTPLNVARVNDAFINATFPLGVMHEFICTDTEDTAPTRGFIAGLLGQLIQSCGVAAWISASQTIFPPALKFFGIEPDQVIFINLKNEKDVRWTLEEALRCNRISAVIAEMNELSFNQSRRLQLAVEQSGVTGFIIRVRPRNLSPTACVTRWKINSVRSELEDSMPGVGFPRWNVELLKVRNGKPGKWKIEWSFNHFQNIQENVFIIPREQRRKTG
jgi:protein ImuA